MFRRIAAALLVFCFLGSGSGLAQAAGGGTYSDVPPGDWSEVAIHDAAAYGLMGGIGGGKFGYGLTMNRASFAAVLCRMQAWETVTPATPSFSDCAPGHWGFSWVETALKHGVLSPAATVRPDDPITRSEMAVMLVRALGYDALAQSQAKADLPFPDVTAHRGYIALAYRFGIIGGIGAGDKLLFAPDQTATREQAAAMLVRAYEPAQRNLEWIHGFYAQHSYPQIDLARQMSAVSVGWARLEAGPTLNQTASGGNEWAVPQQSALATDAFAAASVPCNLSVFASGAPLVAALETPEAQAKTVQLLVAAAAPYAGITLDFEGLRAPQKTSFGNFVLALRTALPEGAKLYVCVQPPDWYDGYDYATLASCSDMLLLMAHDYQSNDLPVVGSYPKDNPVAPLTGVYSTLAAISAQMHNPRKLALALSFSSIGYELDADGKIASQTVVHPGPDTLALRLRQPDSVQGWSNSARSPYLDYTADGKRYRVWYENADSVAEKLALARYFGVTRVSLWRIGSIPNDPDGALHYNVWQTLMKHS